MTIRKLYVTAEGNIKQTVLIGWGGHSECRRNESGINQKAVFKDAIHLSKLFKYNPYTHTHTHKSQTHTHKIHTSSTEILYSKIGRAHV